MIPRPSRRLFALVVLMSLVSAARADGPVKTPAEEQLLSTILGSPLDDWNFSRRGGSDFDHKLIQAEGRTVLAAGPNATILDRKTPLENDTEVRITLRLHHPENKEVWYWLMLGHTEPAKYYESPFGLSFSMPAAAEQDWFYWNAKGKPARDGRPAEPTIQGRYVGRELPKNRLTWPELVRARIEHEYASQRSAADRWLVIRIVFRKGSIQYYLDDRLLRETTGDGVEGAGLLNMTLFDGVQLWSIRTRKLPPDDPRFLPVALDSDLNASEFRGRKLTSDFIPEPEKPVVIDGVPFVIPRPDAKGNNHIDLGASWLSCGTLDGQFDAGSGDLPRWPGALHRMPGRIQFRVRNARYGKLHVLAADSGLPNTTSKLYAQFFRAGAGHPLESWPERHITPVFDNFRSDQKALKLTHLTIPLRQGEEGMAAFTDQKWLDFELTRELHPYRSFPDPIYYGRHAGGLPSGIHIFAVTLEKPEVEAWLEPDAFAHIWTAPDVPSYTVHLKNNTDREQQIPVTIHSQPAYRFSKKKDDPTTNVTLAPFGSHSFQAKLTCEAYGLHTVWINLGEKNRSIHELYHFAHLHPDTRERGGWEEGKGPIFGFWDWNGGHETPSGMNRLRTMVAAGAESSMHSFEAGVGTPTPSLSAEEREYAEKNGMLTFFLGYQLSMGPHSLGGKAWDASKPAEMEKALIDWLKSQPASKTTKLNRPDLAIFFAEPIVGPISYMSLPHLYGEPEYQLTDAEKTAFKSYRDQFVTAARAIKREWPGTKCLFPWGLPLFPAAFLKDQEARELMDGPCLDVVLFERLPEMQLHQVTLSSQLWQLKQEWLRAGKTWPNFTAIEGPAISPAQESSFNDAGGLSEVEESNHTIRSFMILSAYGTTRHLGWPTPFACAGFWGETHYGGGLCRRQPILSPKRVFCTYATMTRQLNRMNFVKQVPTGSNTVFCLQFKHYKTGELLHVFWTIRGVRPVTVEADLTKLVATDEMDNPMALEGKPTIRVWSSPCYVRGLADGAKITLGEPDHFDSRYSSLDKPVGNLGDGSWSLSAERDLDYENSHPEFVRRFPGKFSAPLADAPETMPATPGDKPLPTGGKALAIHLEPQEKERKTMPFYTTVVPKAPIELPGMPSDLHLWVRAASDWGRVVYCLRDAKGERWISVGRSGEWNVDDVHCWSAFNFDGWRLLKFELPGNAPHDLYRYAGTSFWGNYGPGDAIVDYPLTLEKILVERRTHVIHGTELVPADPSDVLLGQLFVRYQRPGSQGPEAVAQSRLRMPVPDAPPALENPIAKLTGTGVGAAATITKIEMPEREYDGRRCHVHFTPVDGAKSYNVWVSTYEDGRGAIQLGTNWTASGQLLSGLVPNVDLYLFVTYVDNDGKPSKPSAPIKVRLKDMFAMK